MTIPKAPAPNLSVGKSMVPVWAMEGEQLDRFISAMKLADVVAVDTESNAEDLRDKTGHVIGFSVSFRVGGAEPYRAYFPVQHIDTNYPSASVDKVFEELYKHTLIFHNAKHDLVALASMGRPFYGMFYDTMLMVHMLDENLPSKALDYVSRHYLGAEYHKERSVEMQAFIDLYGWGHLPANMVVEYAEHDAYLTLLVFEKLITKFRREVPSATWEFEQEFVRTIIEIERAGVRIDPEFIQREINRGEAIMDDIAESLGFIPAGTALQEFLLDHLQLPVVKQTKKGKPSFDKEAMAIYDQMLEDKDDESAKYVLVYRGWQKAISASYRGFFKFVSSDGRLRANYKIHGTRTGRLSCEQPNLQQIPRSSSNDWNGGLKQSFVPTDGFTLIDFDYGQLELRLGAAYAKESGLLDVFADDRDVFTEMATETGMKRQDCKTLNYTIQFGGGARRLSTVFKISVQEAQGMLENYYSKYPRLRNAGKKAEIIVRKHGKIQLWSGRYRHFTPYEKREKPYKAFNALIQGGAADIVKRQIVKVHKSLDPDVARIVLTVHDSIVVEIRNDKLEETVTYILNILQDVKPDFGVKFAAEAKVWGS